MRYILRENGRFLFIVVYIVSLGGNSEFTPQKKGGKPERIHFFCFFEKGLIYFQGLQYVSFREGTLPKSGWKSNE